MKRFIISFVSITVSFLILITLIIPAAAADYTGVQTVTVTGRGILRVKADTATLSFGIETRDKDVLTAQTKNEKLTAEIKALASAFGCITDESYYSYEDPSTGIDTISRYMTLVTGRVNDIPALTDKLIESGASCVNCICYNVKNLAPFEYEVLRFAIADAENKAAGLGLKLNLTEITELGCYSYYDGSCGQNAGKQVVIECNINAVFGVK